MKKISVLMIVILLLCAVFPAADAKEDAVEIATREDLMRIADAPSGSYVLTADIDLCGEPWTPIPFSGTFDGAGHTIGNLTVTRTGEDTTVTYDGNRVEYDTSCAGLFSVVTDAQIRDLTLVNVKIAIETDRNCFSGAIAGYAKNTVISDCTVSVRSTMTISAINCGVGGIVGFSEGSDFEHCAVEAELVFLDVNPDVLCEEFLGGVYASGCGNIKDCTAYTRGYADIYGYAHNGGMVGMFKLRRGYKGKMHSIRDSSVDAEIRFFEVTPSKRAYCEAIIGENCAGDCYLTHNKELHFDFTYRNTAVPMRPESCEAPSYRSVVTEPTCTAWGYTTYTCEACGYTCRDDYTKPRHKYAEDVVQATCTEAGKAVYTCVFCGDSYIETIPAAGHTPGDWTVTKAAGPDEAWEETLFCSVCGAPLETRAIPAASPSSAPPAITDSEVLSVQQIVLAETVIELLTGDAADLQVTVTPSDVPTGELRFESSDPAVVRVDRDGRLTALGPGTATIRVYSADGSAETTCSVLVTAKPQQEEGHSLLRCG